MEIEFIRYLDTFNTVEMAESKAEATGKVLTKVISTNRNPLFLFYKTNKLKENNVF